MVRYAAAVMGAVLLLVSVARAEEEETPRIFLEKKIFAETSSGGKNFFEVHTVSDGETLWKILGRKSPIFPADYPSLLREFRHANPDVKDPGRLFPGQKILVPSGSGMKTARLVETGRTVPYLIRKGDSLSGILTSRGVARGELPRYLDAVKELNESIRDVNVILAGDTVLLPTQEYFGKPPPAPVAVAAADAPSPAAPAPAPPGVVEPPPPGKPEVPLTRDAAPEEAGEPLAPALPEAEVAAPAPFPAETPAVMTVPKAQEPESPPAPPSKPPFRGLLSDLVAGLGETWVDRGTLYLPIPSGGEVVLNLEEYPVVRFSGGIHALIDFRGALPAEVRRLITEAWRNYRVVPMDGDAGAAGMIDRLLAASGYHSVRQGLAHPPVIGETVSVSLPARWVVLRTEQSLLTGEVILVKEVPEKPDADLSAVLRYAGRVGIRVLPFATDPSVGEGFLVGLDPVPAGEGTAPEATLPRGGLEAFDFSLAFLGLSGEEGRRIRIGGGRESFLLTIQPERMFEAGGKRFVVDTGRMSPALRAIIRNSGFEVFDLAKNETGIAIFRKLLSAARIPYGERNGFLLAGGEEKGYEVRATGTFITSRPWLEGKGIREAILVRGKVHSATRELMREFGVEIVEW